MKQDTYSRLIGWLKITLPLLALVILSTLFLVARTVDPEDALPYADIDVAERLREPRMTAPTYAGLTRDGAALTVSADEARPAAADGTGARALMLTGLLETPDGARTDLSAAEGQIDTEARQIVLTGGVIVTSSSGWQVQTDRLTAAMDQTDIAALAPVTAKGPAGTVTANQMRLTQSPTANGQYLLVFNGAVKLIYLPAN
jgi:lipopolysaccharide export system protein LptC